MNTIVSRGMRLSVMSLLTSGLTACAACGPGGSGVIQQHCLPEDYDCFSGSDGGSGGGGDVGTDVYERRAWIEVFNNASKQATFCLSGGGTAASDSIYATQWLPAGKSKVIGDTMAGPQGATLPLQVRVTAEMFQSRQFFFDIPLTSSDLLCSLVLTDDGHELSLGQSCRSVTTPPGT
jgi:hypothetical protein